MLKVLIRVVSEDTSFFNGAITILERQHNGVELVGLTSVREIGLAKDGRNVPFLPLDKIGEAVYDILLVVGARQVGMSQVVQAARQLNLPEEKLLGDRVVCIPGFTLKKYRQLQRSRLSIFSINCFGGFISHTLGLTFRSPFVNMFFNSEKEYLRFLRAPRVYLEEQLIFKESMWQSLYLEVVL